MQELMKRQKTLMLKNNHEIAQQYMELQVINQDFKAMRNQMECFLFNASYFLCLKGYVYQEMLLCFIDGYFY